MARSSLEIVLAVLMLFPLGTGKCAGPDRSVATCDQVTLARPGFGASYRGTVRNSDYRFSATIPDGLAGSGTAPPAPFHGFAIYTSSGSGVTSCIVFLIAIHVDLGEEDRSEPKKGRAEEVRVGNRLGWRTRTAGSIRGVAYENLAVRLELPREGYKNDVEFVLVTPEAEASRTEAIFTKFLASFRFW